MSNLPQKYVDDKTPIAVSPLGGGADDWDNIFGSGGIAASAADQGKVLLFTDGYYLAKTAQSLPSNISIEFSPNVLIVSSIAPAGSFPGNYVYHLDAPSSIQTGSLAATPAIGSTSLSVSITSKPTVGNYLQLTHGVSAAVYKVVAASGVSSPWTITIDRSTNLPWTSTAGGDAVDEYASHPSDIKFNAAGKIAGTGDQLVQIVRTSRYWMSGLNFVPDGGFPTGVAGFDLGCRDCGFEDCILDLTGSDNTHGSIGFFAQSTEHAIFRRLRVKNAAVVGAEILDCFGAQVEDCHFEGGGIGVSLSSFGANDGKNSFGSYFCTAINGTAVGSVIGAAVAYVGASYGCAIENYATIACTSFGIYVGAGGIATRIINCDVSNSDVGILVQSGAQDTKIVGLRADNCTTVALSVGSALDLTGMTSTVNYSSNGVINFSGTDVWRVRGLDLTQNNNNGYLLYVTSPGRLEIDGAILQGSCAVGIFINAATTVVIRNTKITAANQGIFVASGATLIVGEGVDLSGCTSPFTGTGKVIGKFNDVSAIAMTTADHTATWAEYAVDTILLLGTLGTSRNLVLPKISFNWLINNGTDQTVTVKGSTGTGIAIPSGATARVFFNGTNFVISTATVFEGTVAQFNDTTPDEALRLALNGAGATSITAASGVTAFTINQTDLTSNSGVGASLILQAQNETGTTSTGGKLVLGSGSGTSTNGAVQFNSGTTTLGSFSLNSTTDWRMTLDSGLTNLVFQANGPSHTMVLQALDGSGSINIQAPTVVYYDNIPTEAFRFNLSSNGSTSLVVASSVTSFNINYNQMSGTGSNNGGTTNINAQAGQNQSGANNNNNGGNVIISGGAAGTGGSGTAGLQGEIHLLAAGQTFDFSQNNGVGYIQNLSGLWFNSGTGLLQFTGGAFNIAGLTVQIEDPGNGNLVMSFPTAYNSAASLTFANTLPSVTIKQTDLTTVSGTGATFTIQAQNETGTTGTGGDLVLQTGTGTSTAGTFRQKLGSAEFCFANTSAVVYKTGLFYMQDASAQDGIIFSLAGTGTTSIVFGNAVTAPTIGQYTLVGTGSANGVNLTIQSQGGQAQSGSNANTFGGNIVLATGPAGTGGSGAAGAPGSILVNFGATNAMAIEPAGAGITWLMGSTIPFSIFQGTSGQSWYFISGVVNFEATTITWYDFSIQKAVDWNLNGAGGSNMTIAAGTTFTFEQATVAGTGTHAGSTLTIQSQAGQLQTGSANNNNGGNLVLQSGAAGTGGSGTAAVPGNIAIKCGTQPIGVFQSLGPGDGRFTTDSSISTLVFAANQTSQGIYFQALGSGGQINFQTGQVIFYDGSVSQTLQLILASGGATSLTISSTVTGFTLGYADNTVNSATASPLVLFAQNATGTGATGGDVDIGSGKGTSTHGKIGLYVGGAGAVSPALFELKTTSATMKLNSVTILSFDTSTGIMAIGDNVDTAHVDLFAGGSVRTWTNSVNGFSASDTLISFGVASVSFASSVASPVISQANIGGSGSTGQNFTVHGQNATGGGSSTGGALSLSGGTGNTNGKVQLQDGGTTITSVGGSTMTMASGVFCKKINVTNSATGSITIDMSTGNIQEINMTGNITTLTFSNLKTGSTYTLAFIQDAGTGSHTLSLPAAMHVSGGTFTLTSNKGIRDNITLYYDGTVMHEVCRSMNITN